MKPISLFRRRWAGFALAFAGVLGAGSAVATTGEPGLSLASTVPSLAGAPDDEQTWSLHAVLAERKLYLLSAGDTVKVYDVAIGTPDYPTPTGQFMIRRIIWNPGWTPPPESEWARGLEPREPGDPRNPMKTAKLFFREPDYYIHGTGDVTSLGTAASHGCLRMHPDDVAMLASEIMTAGGVKHDWSWVKRTLRLGRSRTVNVGRPVPLTIEEGIAPFDSSDVIADVEAATR
jgi:hypothetical protein